MFSGAIVQLDTFRFPLQFSCAGVYAGSNNSGNIGHSAKRRFHFLHLTGFDPEIVIGAYGVEEVLLFLPLKGDLDFLVH